MKLVIDIDETISEWNDDRDYLSFVPKQDVIDKINALYDAGHEIVLFTARGMQSLNGDIDKIQDEIYPPLKSWLINNGVKHHQLLLGKPWADFYIDDKNMTIDEFLIGDF